MPIPILTSLSSCHRDDFEIGGVPIHNYSMEKRLAG